MADYNVVIVPIPRPHAVHETIAEAYSDFQAVLIKSSAEPVVVPDVPDVTAPVVSGVSPTPGAMAGSTRAERRRQAVTFDVTDIDPGIALIMVTMKYDLEVDTTVVYDGTNFVGLFDNDETTKTAITDGFRFTLLPSGGWRGTFSINIVNVDEAGNVGVV